MVERMDRPHTWFIPKWFGSGLLPRKELHQAAEQLTANQAGLNRGGRANHRKGLDKAFKGAAKA